MLIIEVVMVMVMMIVLVKVMIVVLVVGMQEMNESLTWPPSRSLVVQQRLPLCVAMFSLVPSCINEVCFLADEAPGRCLTVLINIHPRVSV